MRATPRQAGPPRSLLDYCIAAGGFRKGMRVATFIATWTIAQRDIGRVPTVDEAADWWKESRTTWFRRQEDFRSIFSDDNPGAIAAALILEHEDRVDQIGSVLGVMGQVPAPVARLV